MWQLVHRLALTLGAGFCLQDSAPPDSTAPVSTAPAIAPPQARAVQIPGNDAEPQWARWWIPAGAEAAPLLLCLHTWNGDWKQRSPGDEYLRCAQDRGWAFLHPDFRGPNRRPEACASPAAVDDLLAALRWALQQPGVDRRRVLLVGTSGGGHMALVMAREHPERFRAVSAWVPISDLQRWHAECRARPKFAHYADHLESICGGPPGPQTAAEYRRRSPIHGLEHAKGLAIDLQCGWNDGHSGSVPIGHSLRAFNVLARANGHPEQAFTQEAIASLQARKPIERMLSAPDAASHETRKHALLLRRNAGPVRLSIFDGGHETDARSACAWLALQTRE